MNRISRMVQPSPSVRATMPYRDGPTDRPNWCVGQPVARFDSDEEGIVVEANEVAIKVKWQSGATSYYRHGKPCNVQLVNIRRKR